MRLRQALLKSSHPPSPATDTRSRRSKGCWLFVVLFLGWYLAGVVRIFANLPNPHPQVCAGEACVNIEIASSAADLRRGLQGRESLDASQGMLFVFPDDGLHRFWMKDVKFSIDMIWIGHDRRVVFVAPDVPACEADPCPKYGPNQMARYVLEVPSGFAARHNIKPGIELSFKDVPPEFIAQN